MRKSIDLEPELLREIEDLQSATKEKAATVIRLALRCGLPLVRERFQAPRSESELAEVYRLHPQRDPNKELPAKPKRNGK